MRLFVLFCLCVPVVMVLSACGPKRPVLYPNSHLKDIGQVQADKDINDCITLANDYQAGGSKGKEIAKDTGKAGVVGAATGAVIGAITGGAGRGAAIGGAGAATAAMASGVMRSDEPDPVFKQFVEQCLREKGFQSIGWK